MSTGEYYVYWRVAIRGNPWTKIGPFDRDRARQTKAHYAKQQGREAYMRRIKEGDSTSPSDLRASGLLPK